MEKIEKRQGLANFVFLQVADVVPVEPGRSLRNFFAGLLHAALAENGLSGRSRSSHGGGRMSLGDSHETDGRRGPAGAAGGFVDALLRGGQLCRNMLHKIC